MFKLGCMLLTAIGIGLLAGFMVVVVGSALLDALLAWQAIARYSSQPAA